MLFHIHYFQQFLVGFIMPSSYTDTKYSILFTLSYSLLSSPQWSPEIVQQLH
jgi:hypothetical protein